MQYLRVHVGAAGSNAGSIPISCGVQVVTAFPISSKPELQL